MIDWLVQSSIWLSCIVLLLIASVRFGPRLIGAELSYKLWLAVPLSFLLVQLAEHSQAQFMPSEMVYSIQYTSAQINQGLVDWQGLLMGFWLAGLGLFLCLFIAAHRQFFSQIEAHESTDKELINDVNSNWQTPARLPKILTTHKAISPFVSGLWQANLVLPAHFMSFDRTFRKLIVQHEYVHWQRKDMLWNLFAQAVVLMFWFNPLIWLAYFQYRYVQEQACDQVVLANCNKSIRVAYAKAMLMCAARHGQMPLHLTHYGANQNMQKRIQLLSKHQHQTVRQKMVAYLAILVVSVCAGAAFAGNKANSGASVNPAMLDKSVNPVSLVEPVYPKQAAEENVEGDVTLEFDVNPDGSVSNVKVIQSEPSRVFDREAKKAVRQWLYEKPSNKIEDVRVVLEFRLDALDKNKL